MKRVIFDTNFIIMQFIRKVDIITNLEEMIKEKVEFITPSIVLDEINSISRKKSKYSRYARAGIKWLTDMVKRGKIKIIKVTKVKVFDNWILSLSRKSYKNLIVCTEDRALKMILKGKGVKVYTISEVERCIK